MAHISYTELRMHLVEYMDEVCDNRAPLHITRQNSRSVVMMSETEYAGIMETLHLLRSPANAARLLRSIAIADLIGSVNGMPADLSTRKKKHLKATGYGRKRPR